MRRIYCWVMALILGLALIPIPGAAAVSDSWTLSSADGRIQITLFLSNSSLCYTASMDGIPVLGQSRLGLYTAMADFTYGVSVTSAEQNSFRETYPMLTGKSSSYTNDYTELVLTVEKEGHQMRVYVRAYEDGFAFRYGLSENTKVLTEATQFNLGAAQAVHAQEYEKCYEAFYEKRKMQDMFGLYAMPALAWLENGSYALITEAALNGSYCGSVLRSTGDGVLRTEFEPKQTEMVEIEAPFTSPWRAVVLGDANTIASTQMPENLNPPCAISDTSWIIPGVSAWTWFNGDPTGDPEIYKQYIDFAAESGWQYMLLDEGWQPRNNTEPDQKSYLGTYDWVPEIIQYAKDRNIGIWVWAAQWDLNSAEKQARLAEWADMGICGVKIDFFDSETQEMLRLYDTLTAKCADLKLMVNYHGCHKPTGERRTWPHLVTREGVYGNEHFLSGEGWGPTAAHNCTLPFTRNAVGPMDYTPSLTTCYEKEFETPAQRGALAVVFESGAVTLSDKPEVYRSNAFYGFLKGLPAAWDATRLLDGVPGSFVVMLRQKQDQYYIGSICNEQRTQDISLSFLPEGRYLCEIYYDGSAGTARRIQQVTNRETVTLPQQEHGGAAIRLTPWSGAWFQDMDNHWAQPEVQPLADTDRLSGFLYPNFQPDQPITRGEFADSLLRISQTQKEQGTPPFADAVNHFEKNAIYTAWKSQIVNGVSDLVFDSDSTITREDAATMIGRFCNLSAEQSTLKDYGAISDYAKPYVSGCQNVGIIKGYTDGTFLPKQNVTRAEAVAMLARCPF